MIRKSSKITKVLLIYHKKRKCLKITPALFSSACCLNSPSLPVLVPKVSAVDVVQKLT